MPLVHGRNLDLPEKKLADFCERWRITELAFFGSVLRDDFDDASDLDILVAFPRLTAGSFYDRI